jgi:predicted nucleic acid-binding protein
VTVLPDTSVWVDYLRGTEPTATELDRLLWEEPPAICGPIVAELLAGVATAQRGELWLALASLPYVELGRDAWALAGDLARELRSAGRSVPLVDLLVAVAAVRSDAALWTRDEDFQRVRDVLPDLRLHR